MSLEKFGNTITEFVPDNSVPLILSLVKKNPFHLRITEPRSTKKGDFRPTLKKGAYHKISVNGDMNEYEFLVTFLHEYAHLLTWNTHLNKVSPHGIEWKKNFEFTLLPFIENGCFPEDLVVALRSHLVNPKASSCVDINLQKTMSGYDSGPKKITIEDIPEEAIFLYSKDRLFQKGPRLRKRYKCKSLDNNRYYLFSPLAEVTVVEEEPTKTL